ncbi:MAG: RNA polymerase factor sigma-54 [Candidatus Mcinerneyibacterium aminivorans]|uniref:RNA polymerase factor sigma-54 n=1 Tax=Candidatus Mcinerneyibacterium aminivorans TaxID=2703815 RepID=A0A5D0M9P1_9BACT|nr:MAG: RNA polymerase factor sigma-54 [Candidatus Mcinerneyibacterium aminivorans]
MNNEIRLETNLTQKLSLSQKISLNILVKNELQLRQYLHSEMEVNPFLELGTEREVQETEESEELEEILEEYEGSGNLSGKSQIKKNDNSFLVENYTGPDNWRSNLLEEIKLSKFAKKEKKILEDILYSINEEGFLEEEKSIQEENDLSKDEFVDYLEDFLFLSDGIGARNLAESYKWQLKSKGVEIKQLLEIVTNYAEDIKNGRLDKVLKKENIEKDKYEYYKSLLKSLSNKPGYALEDDSIEYIQPDVIIKRTKDNDFRIEVSDKYNTFFSVNKRYLNIMKKKDKLKKSEKNFLKKYYKRYKYIKQSLESRRETLKKLAKYLLEYQKSFFEKGPKYLKPLTRTKVAEDLEYHPSTIARTVQNKYVQTDFGIFPMAIFFPKSANEKSRILIYLTIKNIVDNEDKKNPYSDSQISEELQNKGIDIKRRTVSKYRKKIGIPSRRERKI